MGDVVAYAHDIGCALGRIIIIIFQNTTEWSDPDGTTGRSSHKGKVAKWALEGLTEVGKDFPASSCVMQPHHHHICKWLHGDLEGHGHCWDKKGTGSRLMCQDLTTI